MQPIRAETLPKLRTIDRRTQPREQGFGHRLFVEEGAAGAGPYRAGVASRHAEPRPRGVGRSAQRDDGARTHVLLLAHDLRHAAIAEIRKSFLRALQPSLARAGLRGRHGRRQIGEPLRRNRKPAHDLQRGGSIFLRHHHAASQFGVDPAPAANVLDVEKMVRIGLGRDCIVRPAERTHRLAPNRFGRNIDQLLLRPAQRRQLAAEDAAGVDANGVVHPIGPHHRSVAIDHGRRTPVARGPIGADRQAEGVDLAGGFAVKRERAHSARAAADHGFLQAGMRHRQSPVIEPEMAAQPIEKRRQGVSQPAILSA